jgi:hypothetical protein
MASTVLITGIPSPGKARLRAALEHAGFSLGPAPGALRIHAETDLEGFIESNALTEARADRARAHLVVAVDWERLDDVLGRVKALAGGNRSAA